LFNKNEEEGEKHEFVCWKLICGDGMKLVVLLCKYQQNHNNYKLRKQSLTLFLLLLLMLLVFVPEQNWILISLKQTLSLCSMINWKINSIFVFKFRADWRRSFFNNRLLQLQLHFQFLELSSSAFKLEVRHVSNFLKFSLFILEIIHKTKGGNWI